MTKRMKLKMDPDYGDALFWDEEDACCGGCKYVFIDEDDEEKEIDLSTIEDLEDWFYDWHHNTLYATKKWSEDDWKDWWNKGLCLAKEVKKLLPMHVDLYYFTFSDKVWKIHPSDDNGGGLFDYTDPIGIK